MSWLRDHWKGKQLFFLVAAIGVFLDLWTKSYIFERIAQNRGSIPIIEGFFYFSHAENPGGVFGLFADYGGILMILRAVALFVILYFVMKTDATQRMAILAFGFLFAGAMGNLYDNLFNHGSVRDWLDFYLLPPHRWQFPTFNVADVMINVGVGLLILYEFRHGRKTQTQVSPS